ncbi:phosphoribosyl 1,2-cyclic phosphate phosphodiesterase [Alkalitalea saponilacus]|uniref:Phosphoribosyl 1,2-cyclic phosphate phosphodiesterase n=1 Tax=Alkalitalea saponilacus TaxID=889453 RepID=A0A1T5DJ49_9BACT|nr:phosphoribosyl 1,2-cyclic phosphate phosphodiesterase [Alkalitalea saponilacus]
MLNSIDEKPFIVESVPVIPIRVMHHRLPVLAFRIGDFSYVTDANHIPEAEYEKLFGTKILVIDGLRHEPHISHFTLQQALEVIARIKPQGAFITHISHQLGLHDEVNKTLPAGVELAYDGLVFNV